MRRRLRWMGDGMGVAALLLLQLASAARLNVSGRAITYDGRPHLLRGGTLTLAIGPLASCERAWLNTLALVSLSLAVAYSPVPIGNEPSATRTADFFGAESAPIYERDLPRMAAIGVNAVRIYSFEAARAPHTGFFDACLQHNISVIGSFALSASQYDLRTAIGVAQAEVDLRQQLEELRASGGHDAVVMWLVGNEINLPSAGFICDTSSTAGSSTALLGGNNTACQFDGTGLPQLVAAIDRLCGVVRSFGLLCSTPLAEYPLPASYNASAHASMEGATRWFYELDPLMSNIDVWTANVYRPGDFGDWFFAARARTAKPVLVTEYGVDAFDSGWGEDSECEQPPCRRMREDAVSQANMVQRLTEHLERNTVTCIQNCESHVASGGFVFAWVDEWFKGHGPHPWSDPANGPPGTSWWFDEDTEPYGRCPDWDPWLQTPCGYALPNGLDNFWNEEWFGIFSAQRGCPSAPSAPPAADALTPREAFYALGSLWALGGCTLQSIPPARAAESGYNVDAYAAFPDCASAVAQHRAQNALSSPYNTDCDYQYHATQVNASVCPPLPSHLTASSGGGVSLKADARELLQVSPPPPCAVVLTPAETRLANYECLRYPSAPRLQRVPSTAYLLLDCTPWLMRAISYSPVPYGEDPSYFEPFGDYFTDAFSGIFDRDLALLEAMGANAVRLYAWRQSTRHTMFLDAAYARGIAVVAVFEMGTAEDSPVRTAQERALLRARVQARLRVSRHPAIVAWLIGNELNGAWNEYVCDKEYSDLFLHSSCTFGDSAVQLCALVDSLCEVVHAETDALCSTPLAGVNPPNKYIYPLTGSSGLETGGYGMHGWAQICEASRLAPGEEDFGGVRHVDFWSGNLYPGRNFDSFNITMFGEISQLPLMISEFGVDAYNTNCRGDGSEIGCEDQSFQANWVMSLVEDIERHASACTVGCAPEAGRVLIGGAIIGWADEWWKGRVIDAVEFDNRSAAMGDACPDPYANVHSTCGYPSGAQPDTYVNEEWFGLFQIEKPCSNRVDRIRPRIAWHRLRMLWHDGGCIGHYAPSGDYELTYPYERTSADGTTSNGVSSYRVRAPYNVTRYPYCAGAVARLRSDLYRCAAIVEEASATGNQSMIPQSCRLASVISWAGTDCELQAFIASNGDGECPDLPGHMADLNLTVSEAQAAWMPTPAECPDDTAKLLGELVGIVAPIAVALALLCLINHRFITRTLCRRSRRGRCCSRCRVTSRIVKQKRPRRGSQQHYPGSNQQHSDGLTRDSQLKPLIKLLAACTDEPPPPRNLVGAESRRLRDGALRSLLEPIGQMCAEVFGFQTAQLDSSGGAPIQVPSNVDNQIDHLVALLSQRLDRQEECGELHRQPDAFGPALERAASELHEAMLGSYLRWVGRMRLRNRTPVHKTFVTVGSFAYRSAADFGGRADLAARCVCNMQLHRLLLYMLIWGEAANLRHTPECLCLIFYCASNAIMLQHAGFIDHESEQGPTRHSPGAVAQLAPMATADNVRAERSQHPGLAGQLAAPPFLEGVVKPIYDFLAYEIQQCREQDVSKRVMYDDVNEFFWDRRCLSQLLPSLDSKTRQKEGTVSAYAELRSVLRQACSSGEQPPAKGLRVFFKKTYREKISWAHLLKNYRRVFVLHLTSIHVMITVASSDGAWEWRYVSTAMLTHALFSASMNVVGLWAGTVGWRAAMSEVLPMLLSAFLVALFVAELFVCELSAAWLGVGRPPSEIDNICFSAVASIDVMQDWIYAHNLTLYSNATLGAEASRGFSIGGYSTGGGESMLSLVLGMRSIYEVAALLYAAYVALTLFWPGLHRCFYARSYLGGAPTCDKLGTRLVYTLLWALILGTKFVFEYFVIIKPVVEPSLCLWRDAGARFYCWAYDAGGNECSTFIPNVTLTDPTTGVALGYFPGGRGFGDAYPEWGIGDGDRFANSANDYLQFIRTFRSFFYRLMLIASRWATPLLLCFADTALFYSVFSSVGGFAIAWLRGQYSTHTWSRVVRELPMSVRLFNEKLLAPRRGVSLLPMYPHTLEFFLREAPIEGPDRLQRFEPSIEACSTEWRAFAGAWNRVISSLRSNDYVSDAERDDLTFHILSDDFATHALGSNYVVLPAMMTSPVCTVGLWKHRATSYPSVLRTMLQGRDLAWYLLSQLGAIKPPWPSSSQATLPDDCQRQRFLCALTGWAELQEEYRGNRRSGDPGPLLGLMGALKNFVQLLVGIADEMVFAGVLDGVPVDEFRPLAQKVARGLAELLKALEEAEQQCRVNVGSNFLREFFLQRNSEENVGSGEPTSSDDYAAVLRSIIMHDESNAHTLNILSLVTQPTVLRCLHRTLNSSNPGGEPRNAEARRQLTFFCNSLHSTLLHQPQPISQMRSWTSFTPHFSEDVSVSSDMLHKPNTDNTTLLAILQALHPDEYDNLCERVGQSQGQSLALRSVRSSVAGGDGLVEPAAADVARWASDRYQVLSRTVRGVMRSGEAIQELARLEGVPSDDVSELIRSKFEMVVACQIYHGLKTSPEQSDNEKAEHIDELRRDYPNLLRIAYVEVPANPAASTLMSMKTGGFLKKRTQLGAVDSLSERSDYSEAAFSSVLLGMSQPADGQGGCEDRVEYKVRLPGNPILGEGKPENQNHAIIFARGEHLQTLDMNQDNYMGESYKMRNLLECFRGRVRIVGFREHIFSESGGAVASFAASNEFVFGTMIQRFLTWPLMVRFHYGHPDVWDKVWAFSNGGVSKASKTLHVSEDIFGGVNTVLRGGEVQYLEYVHCGKARDITFGAANGFEQKISGGNAFQGMSRDFSRIGDRFDLFRLLSVYVSGTGLFVSSSIMFWALYWFAVSIAIFALVRLESFQEDGAGGCSIDVVDAGSGSLYTSQWFLQMGFMLALPLFLEYCGSLGVLSALREILVQILTGKIFFTLFQERTRLYYLHSGLTLGSARYVPTGRSFITMSSNFVVLYSLYARSHFLIAAELLYMMFVYYAFTSQSTAMALIRTWPIWLIVVSILISPWFFNPRAFQGLSVYRNMQEFLAWLDPDSLASRRGKGWARWHADCMRAQRKVAAGRKLLLVLGQKLAPRLFMFAAATAALHIEPIGDGIALNFAIFRTWIMLLSTVLYLLFTLLYWQLAYPRFLREVFQRWRITQALYLWGLRAAVITAFFFCVWLFFTDYMSSLRTVDPVHGYVPYTRNSLAVIVAASSVHIGLCQTLCFISERPKRCCALPSPILRALQSYSDSWYREADMILGELIGVVLLVIGLLPFGFLHSRILFNQMYAGSLLRLQRQRELLLIVSGQAISLTDQRTVVKYVISLVGSAFAAFAEFLGWCLSLCALRQTVTHCLRQTCCKADRAELNYTAIYDTDSGRFVPTSEELAAIPNCAVDGYITEAFLAKLDGPIAELKALGMVDDDSISTTAAQSATGGDHHGGVESGDARSTADAPATTVSAPHPSFAPSAASAAESSSRASAASDIPASESDASSRQASFQGAAASSTTDTPPASLVPQPVAPPVVAPPAEDPFGGLPPELLATQMLPSEAETLPASQPAMPASPQAAVSTSGSFTTASVSYAQRAGQLYYWNHVTSSVQYELPRTNLDQWYSIDEKANRKIFTFLATGESTWKRPAGFVAQQPSAARPAPAAPSRRLHSRLRGASESSSIQTEAPQAAPEGARSARLQRAAPASSPSPDGAQRLSGTQRRSSPHSEVASIAPAPSGVESESASRSNSLKRAPSVRIHRVGATIKWSAAVGREQSEYNQRLKELDESEQQRLAEAKREASAAHAFTGFELPSEMREEGASMLSEQEDATLLQRDTSSTQLTPHSSMRYNSGGDSHRSVGSSSHDAPATSMRTMSMSARSIRQGKKIMSSLMQFGPSFAVDDRRRLRTIQSSADLLADEASSADELNEPLSPRQATTESGGGALSPQQTGSPSGPIDDVELEIETAAAEEQRTSRAHFALSPAAVADEQQPTVAELSAEFETSGRVIPERVRHCDVVDRGERQSVLRRIIGAVAYDLADSFGFQKSHELTPGSSLQQKVLSNVANQVENLVCLISNRMDACEGKEFVYALYDAIAGLHAKVFENYENWVRRLGLLPRVDEKPTGVQMEDGLPYLFLANYDVTISDFASLDEGYAWVHNAQLQRLTLYSLLHGEAANLRHLPECLCYVFYGMAHSLVLVDTRDLYKATGIDFPEVQMCLPEHRPPQPGRRGGSEPFGNEDYLTRIIQPMYDFIEHEVSKRREEPVAARVMYDDITECFWQRSMIDLLLPIAPAGISERERPRYQAVHAYAHLRSLLQNPGRAARALVDNGLLPAHAAAKHDGRHALRAFFGKTYLEKPGWAHCYHVFGRVLLWHAICFHAALVGVFYGWTWQELNVVCITHAVGKIIRQLVDMYIGHPPRGPQSSVFGFRVSGSSSCSEHITLILCYCVVPATYAIERVFRRHGYTTLYDIASTMYVVSFAGSYFVHSKPGYRLRSLWRDAHEQHIGSQEQLKVPLGSFVTYCAFWAVVLAAKLSFDIFFIITPLKEPIDGLLAYPFPRIMWRSCSSGFCLVFEPLIRYVLVALRMSVPFFVFYFDTYIFFNVGLAIFSSLIALRRKIGVVSHWRHVVTYLQENVRDFNAKLLGTSNGDAARAARAQALSGKPDWCIEARSLEWQCYARAWNSIVETLREGDALSDVERDELVFGFLTGAESDCFFELPEYVIFPTFVTSPVLSINSSAVRLQQAARASVRGLGEHSYGSFARTMQQTRDLLLWLLVRLGVIPFESRVDVLNAISLLATLDWKHMLHRSGSQERAQRLCSAVATFIKSVQHHMQQFQLSAEAADSNAERAAARSVANDLSLHVTHLLRKTKQIFLEGIDARSVSSAADTAAYHECVDAWDRLQQLMEPNELEVEYAWREAVRLPAFGMVVAALHRTFWTDNPGGEPRNAEAKRQLLFFCNSLFNTTLSKPPPVSRMKSFTSFTPHYAEDVTYSMAALREEKEGVNGTLLNLLTSLFSEEWHNFCERVGVLHTSNKLPTTLEPQLQRWASDRAQVLSRTVRGVMRYGEALRVLARLEGVREEELEMTVASKFEYIVTSQIYGQLKQSAAGSENAWKAAAIDELREQYANHLRVAYVEGDVKKPREPFYSLLLVVEPISRVDRVQYKVRLPGNPIVGEGKPENQNHAIIFARGEHLQTLDMNQDNYMGESYKMRNLLECFRGRVRIVGFREHIFSESGGAVASFAASNEFVFGTMIQRFLTWPLMVRFHYGHPDVWDKVWAFSNGGVSKASKTLHVSEDIFAGFNTVLRGGDVQYLEYLHCGKGRDMGFTAVNGFETKISAGNALQCTSRDLYRMGKHFDLARLFSLFFSGSGFYITTMMTIQAVYFFALTQLILALCGAELFEYDYELVDSASTVLAERRLQDLASPLPRSIAPLHPHQLALYGDTIQAGGQNVSTPPSLGVASGSIYSAAYVLQLGFVMMLPYAMELWVETSLWRAIVGTLKMICAFSFLFSLFTMQTKGFHFTNALSFGRAGYVATGRGFQMDTLSLVDLYAKYAESHIHRGFEMLVYLVLFWLTSMQDATVIAISSINVILVSIALMLSPWIFNPGALTFSAVMAAFRDWRLWVDSTGRFEKADINWTTWHKKRMASVRSSRLGHKLLLAAQIAAPRLVLVLACTACLRSSRVLAKFDPLWALAIVLSGALELVALCLVHFLIQQLIEVRILKKCLGDFARFVLTQANRALLILVWFAANWYIWESWCWQISCSQEAAAMRSCEFNPFASTGAIAGFTCVADPPSPRSCDRACTTESLDSESVRCVGADAYGACVIAGGTPAACMARHADPILEDYEVCMAGSPSLAIAFVAAFTVCVMLVQWTGLIDRHGWTSWVKRGEANAARSFEHQRQVLGCIVGQQLPRGMTADEIVAQLPDVPLADIQRALRSLSAGCLPILAFRKGLASSPGLASAQRLTSTTRREPVVYFTLRALPRCRACVVSCIAPWESAPRHVASALANAAGAVSDFFYRLFDLSVALVLFILITLLTLLPLHEAQANLLFNANFWQIIRRGMRTTDFLESLWA